ncbi:MAG: PorT family protein [Muribaculaceae bacterium]|nr:PorT family protein [Muribaculaceae bacterium]
MKKVLMLITAAIVWMSASAQMQFGVKVGVDATNFWGKGIVPSPQASEYPFRVNHDMKFNYQAGLVMEYTFTDKFAISPEVVFAAQGGKRTLDNPALPVSQRTAKYTTNYINVPVMLKYYLSPAFSIDLGPQVGFNVYSKGNGVDVKGSTKTVDFGVGLGGTYNLTDKAFVQARYTLGMTNVFKYDNDDCKNSNIQLAFGMKF